MINNGLSSASQAVLAKRIEQKETSETNSTTQAPQAEEKKDGKKKLVLALAGLATVGVAVALGVKIYKGKGLGNIQQKLLKDIQFEKGVANLNGEKFTGIVEDTLKNGDKIKLEYVDGIIKKSSREGAKTFEKIFETLEDGTHKITTTTGDKTSEVIIENIKNAAIKSQNDLKALLSKKNSLSLEEFDKQAKEIKYVSAKQKNEINEIIENKKSALNQPKRRRRATQQQTPEQLLQPKAQLQQSAYNQRLSNPLSLKKRMRNIYGENELFFNFKGKGISKSAYRQLKQLSKEQLAALSDEDLMYLLENSKNGLQNFDILKNCSSDEIFKIFSNDEKKYAMKTILATRDFEQFLPNALRTINKA